MQQSAPESTPFVVDLLTTLRREGYSLAAWARFFVRSWEMSCATARTHPGLTRSWLRVTLLIGTLALGILAATYVVEGAATALHLAPGFVFCVAWQQSDQFWHLGLNRQVQTGEILPRIGIANILTGLRGLGAAFLLSRLIGGLATSAPLALLVFLTGVATDILDGPVARYTGTQSRFGQIADGETDFCLYLAITLILLQDGILPLWLAVIMLLRFLMPLLAALGSYFLCAQPVRFGSTSWGKYAGVAQCLYFLVLLAPPALASITSTVSLPLLVATLALMIAAPVAQIMANKTI
jgi:phosphatidylglycerophosphate synthase